MAAKPSIQKIVFNVHGKTLELTSDEAKELKQILSDLFGETKVVHEWHSWPKPWPYQTWCGTVVGYFEENADLKTERRNHGYKTQTETIRP